LFIAYVTYTYPPVFSPRLQRRPLPPHGQGAADKNQHHRHGAAHATHHGLESLSIGGLAEATSMSKSGVFAHFGSREELQISVVREYHHRFEQEVFYPALQAEKGLPRLRAMFGNWMQRTTIELDSGCIYISGAVEFSDAKARCAMPWWPRSTPGTPPCAGRLSKHRPPAICTPMPTLTSCCLKFTV